MGFESNSRMVRISQPQTATQIELIPASMGCPPPFADIGGRIARGSGTGELWVKAIPIRGIGGGEARVTAN